MTAIITTVVGVIISFFILITLMLHSFVYDELAEIFKQLGGKVIYFGKPHPEIYKFCVKKDEKILVIGDNIRTDIKGANNMKFDSLFITNGVHKHEFLHLPLQNYDKILEKYGTKTNFYQERLIW